MTEYAHQAFADEGAEKRYDRECSGATNEPFDGTMSGDWNDVEECW
jgi:hypothetical protein